MKFFVSIATAFLLIGLSQVSYGQDKPVREKFKWFKGKVNTITKQDSLKLPDSLRLTGSDTIKRKNVLAGTQHKSDSLMQFSKSLEQVSVKTPALPDSLTGRNFPDASNLPGDSLKHHAKQVSDKVSNSAKAINDKLRAKTDSVAIPDPINGVKSKLDRANTNNGAIPAGLPGNTGVPGVTLPSSTAQEIPSTDINLPKADGSVGLPALPTAKKFNPGANLPGVDASSLDVSGKVKEVMPADVPAIQKPDSSDVAELKSRALEDERLKKYAAPVAGVSDKLDPYKKNLDSLTLNDAAGVAGTEGEQLLQTTDVMKTLNENSGRAKSAMSPADMALLQRYQDKRILKDEMLRKSKNVMNDKLSSLSPQVQDQQKKFSKVKKLNSSVPSVKNLKVKRTDPLKERPFYERIVPGISLQSYSGNVFALDIAPQISLRLNSYWSLGAGVLYRIGFDKKYWAFAEGQGVSGFRTFVDCRLVKGLYIHAEYEKITISDRFDYSEKLTTPSFHSTYIGLGKRYPISRKFNGSLMALYKIEMGDHLAGTTKFNLRVVFEYKTKKTRKATAID